mmetsp:Transcript_44854/g.118530  ORF Transcript_44854/g.118530 Transcript_44854/m.118530 type:complete len:85 (+) Transcript_44854:2781-3035(+)
MLPLQTFLISVPFTSTHLPRDPTSKVRPCHSSSAQRAVVVVLVLVQVVVVVEVSPGCVVTVGRTTVAVYEVVVVVVWELVKITS